MGKTTVMDVELRPVTDDEFPEFSRVLEGAFGFHATSDNVADMRSLTELDRTIGAFDGPEIVATAGAFSFELTLPGGALEPAAGVTFVAVRGTHRRRGLLRALMEHQLDDIADRGECLALLTASESSIYRRFGYGPATQQATWSISTEGTTLSDPPHDPGRLRLVDRSEATTLLPGVYDRCRHSIPGAVDRTDAWWEIYFKDREWDRDGASSRFYLVHESAAGETDGFLAFRHRRGSEHSLPTGVLVVDELYGRDPDIEAALWQYAIDHDLVATVEAKGRPVDEPIRWRLTDPRRLVCTDVVDALWVRPMDVPKALAARSYRIHDALVIEVVDPMRPTNDGVYLVEGGPDGAEAGRTDHSPDLSMDVADLGTIYLGGVAATALARAGRIEEHVPGALARADAFFGTAPLPWLTTGF